MVFTTDQNNATKLSTMNILRMLGGRKSGEGGKVTNIHQRRWKTSRQLNSFIRGWGWDFHRRIQFTFGKTGLGSLDQSEASMKHTVSFSANEQPVSSFWQDWPEIWIEIWWGETEKHCIAEQESLTSMSISLPWYAGMKIERMDRYTLSFKMWTYCHGMASWKNWQT